MHLKGNADFVVRVDGELRRIKLRDFNYSADLPWNILAYGKIEERGYDLRYDGTTRAVIRRSDGFKIFDVEKDTNNVLVVRVVPDDVAGIDAMKIEECVAAALVEATSSMIPDAQQGSLLDFHMRFGHLAYDTIERMANDLSSEILLTDKKRSACLMCAQGKQTRNHQSVQDTGTNAPIDRVGGVICSDTKGTIMPIDRCGNRYLINFVDHMCNYCRVFLRKLRIKRPKLLKPSLFTLRSDPTARFTASQLMVEVSIRSSIHFAKKPVCGVRYRNRATKLQTERWSVCTKL